MPPPDKLRIPYEDYEGARFDCIGRLSDGTQFMAFVTGTFTLRPTEGVKSPAESERRKQWIAVIHRFDAEGNHLRTETRPGGADREGRAIAGARAHEQLLPLLAELAAGGQPELGDIWVRPFAVEIDGVPHGLYYEESEDSEPGEPPLEWIMLEPWDIMFHPPWERGQYST